MRIVFVSMLAILSLVVLIEFYLLFSEWHQLKQEAAVLTERIDAITADSARIASELDYLSRPENLEKELRAKFNYKNPDEKMIIIVP